MKIQGEKSMGKLWVKNEKWKGYSYKKYSISNTFGGYRRGLGNYIRKYNNLNQQQLMMLLKAAKEGAWEILDLSNCGLASLPKELWEITSLKVLFLGNGEDKLNSDERNTFKEIPDEIRQLVNLEALSVQGLINVKFSYEISKLPRLVYLDCFHCQMQSFPVALRNNNLKGIGIECKNIEVLRIICNLKHIEDLYLTWSLIEEIPSCIGNLKKLRTLFLVHSQVKKIAEDLGGLKEIKVLDIRDTPLGNKIPEELQKQSAKALIAYIQRLQSESNKYKCLESKMLIVGQGNVGKSCLLERIINNQYEEHESTEGINIKKWTYDSCGKRYTLNIWDFGGQEIYHSTHQFFLTKRSLYIFVWDARAEEEYGRIDYWLKTIESFADDSPIIIAINKCDEKTTRINRIDFQMYKAKYPQIHNIIEISCKDNINIGSLKTAIKKLASNLPIMKDDWLKNWLQVRMELERKRKSKNYIAYFEYREICKKYGLNEEEQKSLSRYLHDLGIILHYGDDLDLRGTIILSPEWATTAVYKILDSQETILKNRNGILCTSDLSEIWQDKQVYPEEYYTFLLKVMEKFELCFKLGKEQFLVSELLENTALPLPLNWDFSNNTIRMIYKYDFMPAGVMTRLIVKLNHYIASDQKRKLCWKRGIYLKYKDAYASVIMTDDILEKKIEIMVSQKVGIDLRRELLSIIRHGLGEVNSMFSKLKVEELVPCNCHKNCNFLFHYDTLCRSLEKGHVEIQCHESFSNVNVLKLLEGIEIKRAEEKENSMYSFVNVNPVITNTVTVDTKNSAVQNQTINIEELHETIMEVHGNLNELLEETNDKSLIEEIEKIKAALEEMESLNKTNDIKKSGKLNKLRRLIEGFSENGEYRKFLEGGKKVAQIVGELAVKYNKIACLVGMQAIPFLQ